MRFFLSAAALLLLAASLVNAAGFVHNENFVVITESGLDPHEDTRFAETVLAAAEKYRREISLEWFGEVLPSGIGRTTISVRHAADRDSGLTWAMDHPDRKMHTVYLFATGEEATGSTLAHEIAHVVLATHFPHPHRLPAWLEEGIASRYDDDQRNQTRGSVLRFFTRQDHWPRIEGVLNAENIAAEDTRSYAAAVSLTEMLLAQGDKETLLQFGRAAARSGWQQAMTDSYRIRNAAQLQQRWQEWVSASASSVPRLSQLTR